MVSRRLIVSFGHVFVSKNYALNSVKAAKDTPKIPTHVGEEIPYDLRD
jgi:hypothetical protein